MATTGEPIGAYRLITRLGAGGMGEVWLAEHALLGRRAAIKLLHPMFSTTPDIVTRFFNEARAATSIADAGIVQIFDFGYHAGSAYIVMEALDGETLDARCRRFGVLPLGEALRIVRQVASSLGAAHARGIVHRDLKPENIFLVHDAEVAAGERPKILDFGIAKLGGDAHLKTQTSAVMGTPSYMSPEQCRGAGQVDARADVYSLGCVLFALIAGRPPFEAEGVGDLIAMHLREPAPRLSTCAPGIPPVLDDLVARCLDKSAGARFASGAELAAAIEALLTGASTAANGASTTLSAAAAQTAASSNPRQGRLVAVGAAGLAIVAAGVWTLVRSSHRHETETPIAVAPLAIELPAPSVTPPSPVPADGPQIAPIEASTRAVLLAFAAWAPHHAKSRCPAIDELAPAGSLVDPWHHPFTLSCTEQPADQIVGVVSAGPDGAFGTNDDIASWKLGDDVTEVVRGPRWTHTDTRRRPSTTRVTVAPPAPPSPLPTPATRPPSSEPNFDDQLNRERERQQRPVKVEPVE